MPGIVEIAHLKITPKLNGSFIPVTFFFHSNFPWEQQISHFTTGDRHWIDTQHWSQRKLAQSNQSLLRLCEHVIAT